MSVRKERCTTVEVKVRLGNDLTVRVIIMFLSSLEKDQDDMEGAYILNGWDASVVTKAVSNRCCSKKIEALLSQISDTSTEDKVFQFRLDGMKRKSPHLMLPMIHKSGTR